MKISVQTVLVIALLTAGACTNGYAEPNKVVYELRERCAKTAAEDFEKNWNAPPGIQKDGSIANYRNHYNAALNKCIYLITVISPPGPKSKDEGSKSISLYDINENNEFGTYFKFNKMPSPMQCNVLEKFCHSEQEWNALAAPYMTQ